MKQDIKVVNDIIRDFIDHSKDVIGYYVKSVCSRDHPRMTKNDGEIEKRINEYIVV